MRQCGATERHGLESRQSLDLGGRARRTHQHRIRLLCCVHAHGTLLALRVAERPQRLRFRPRAELDHTGFRIVLETSKLELSPNVDDVAQMSLAPLFRRLASRWAQKAKEHRAQNWPA